MSQPDCLFCKIIQGHIPADKVLETEQVIAFWDITPQAPTHLLIIPREHTPSVSQTHDEVIFAQLVAAARNLANTLELTDYRLVINNGVEAGQSVFHLHLHLLAGRSFQWPPG